MYRAILGDQVVAVVTAPVHRLVAFAQILSPGSGSSARTVVYVSRDAGHHWKLTNRLGGL